MINHAPALRVLKSSLVGTKVQLTIAIGLADLLEKLDKNEMDYDWVIVDNFGQDAAKDDVGAVLRQIRLRYDGKLASFGYQVGINEQLLLRYQTQALYEPMDKRQLYAMLLNQQNLSAIQSPVRPNLWGVGFWL